MKSKQLFACTTLIGLTLASITAVAVSASPIQANPEHRGFSADEEGGIAAYLHNHSQMTRTDAEKAVRNQGKRASFLKEIVPLEHGSFGGSRYDPVTDTQYLYVTTEAARSRFLKQAYDRRLNVVVQIVPYSYSELEALAETINESRTEEEVATHQFFAAADNSVNRVKVIVESQQNAVKAQALLPHDPRIIVKVIPGPEKSPEADKGLNDFASKIAGVAGSCTWRYGCGTPLRSGIAVGLFPQGTTEPGSTSPKCSLGFTAKAVPDNSFWVLTAGSCTLGIISSCSRTYNPKGCWGHGEQYIGPEREVINRDNVNALRIRVDNRYWHTGGYMYNSGNPQAPVDVDSDAESREQIQRGDYVCFQGRHDDDLPKVNPCSEIIEPLDYRGYVLAYGWTACDGDEGGGVYSPNAKHPSLPGRAAFGMIAQGGGAYCHDEYGTYFSTLPDLYKYWDSRLTSTIRIETR